MRADRLLSMLMILQSRGKTSAQELANELEVSKRTIYRDVIALSISGVPVYTEKGPGGGIALVDKYRSDLTGLTKEEVRALFMISVPPAVTELGLDQQLRAAMLKLSSALSSSMQTDERSLRQRIYIDPTPWEDKPQPGFGVDLKTLQEAVWDSQTLEIRHKSRLRQDLEPVVSIIQPYGLVAKSGKWYLIGKREDHINVTRVDLIVGVQPIGKIFDRPEDFDLISFWKSHCKDKMENRFIFTATVVAQRDKLDWILWVLGDRVQSRILEGKPHGRQDLIIIELDFDHFFASLKGILGLGNVVEVLEPVALRFSIRDYADQILLKYP